MGFVSDKYNREYEQLSKPLEEVREDASWEDGFQASIGFNADENRSYSAFINHNGHEERIRRINELGIDLKPYIEKNLRENGIHRANYSEVAKDYPEIKTDEQIRQERNEMLAKRRAYAKDIMSRSPSSAVIAGDAITMITDPIMWPTLAYSIPVRGVQGLGALAKAAAKGAGKAAAYEGAAEAAVQAMVYSHKMDIGSEYTADDAINSIALAAGIGAGIGALVPLGAKGLEKIIGDENPSIQDYLQKQLDSVDIEKLDDEGLEAYRDVKRIVELIQASPAIDLEKTAKNKLDAKAELLGSAGNKLSRKQVKDIKKEMAQIDSAIKKETEKIASSEITDLAETHKAKHTSKRKAKKIAEKEIQLERKAAISQLEEKKAILTKQLESHNLAKEAEAEISRIDQGHTGSKYNIYKTVDEVTIQDEISILKEAEAFRENYEKNTAYRPEYKQEVVENAPQANIASLEKEVLSRVGIDDSMNIMQSEYDKLDTRVLLDNEDNMINADDVIEELKNESNSIENVMRCVRG
jgi:hypothetical protein